MTDKIPIIRMVRCPWLYRERPVSDCQHCLHMREVKRTHVLCDFTKYWKKHLQEEYGRQVVDKA